MRRWFRPRIGREDDVVWEIKHGFFWFLPASWGWGYQDYANAASQRNQLSAKANKQCLELEETIVKIAQAEASLRAERKSLDEDRYDKNARGKPILLPTKDFDNMLPYTDEPEPLWKTFVASPVWKRILKAHGANETEVEQNKRHKRPKRGTVMISPSDAIDKHPEFFEADGVEQLVRYRPGDHKQKKDSNNSNPNEGKKGNFKQLRGSHPKEDWETQNEYDGRLRGLWNNGERG